MINLLFLYPLFIVILIYFLHMFSSERSPMCGFTVCQPFCEFPFALLFNYNKRAAASLLTCPAISPSARDSSSSFISAS